MESMPDATSACFPFSEFKYKTSDEYPLMIQNNYVILRLSFCDMITCEQSVITDILHRDDMGGFGFEY